MQNHKTIPKVSIIIPMYNREFLIGETIESILMQDFEDFELIIVDDGSTDNSCQVVNNYAKADGRIKLIKSGHTGIIGVKRNIGLTASQGKYISLMDSDDLWKQGKLSSQVKILDEEPTVGFTCCDAEYFRDGVTFKNSIYESLYDKYVDKNASFFMDYIDMRKNFLILSPCILIRKSCYDVIGLISEDFRVGDFDYFTKLTYHFKGRIDFQSLVKIRRHDENDSAEMGVTSFDEILSVLEQNFRSNSINSELYKACRKHTLYKQGIQNYRKKNYQEAHIAFKKCHQENKMYLKAFIRRISAYFMLKIG